MHQTQLDTALLKIAELRSECGQHAMINIELREQLRIAEAIRDDARLASMNDIEAKRVAWATGVQACIDTVKRRHEHYESYRCNCEELNTKRNPETGHRPGCKGSMMSTHPATFAILDEILVFLSALQERGASK
jgi:hypothetical protein